MNSKRIILGILFLFFSVSIFPQTYKYSNPVTDAKLLKQFIQSNIVYPEKSIKNKQEGKVEISFVTDKTGNVTSSTIEKSVSPEINTEALRIFKLILWQPAYIDGIAVEGNNTFSIDFNIKKYNKWVKRRTYKSIYIDYPIDTTNIIYSEKNLDSIPEAKLDNTHKILYNYVYSQIKYPSQAIELQIEGRVEIEFIIETNGLTSNYVINESVGGGCTNEALRIINELQWKPGFKDGLAVRSEKVMFIEFRLSSIKSGQHMPRQSNSGF